MSRREDKYKQMCARINNQHVETFPDVFLSDLIACIQEKTMSFFLVNK